ncbi:MAG: ABC transporter permease [Sumerlaeia bacterium]
MSKLSGDDNLALEGRNDEQALQMLRKQYGLDQPLYIQYFQQVGKLLTFDSQPSRFDRNKTFRTIMKDHFPISASLGLRAITLALVFGIPIGILAAIFHNKPIDQGGTVLALVGVSVPNFILGSLIVFLLVRKLGWFQATNWTDGWNLWIPAVALGAFPFAAILRLTRTAMLDSLREDYIRTARAKGLSEAVVILRHALRNSLTSVVTYVGPVVAGILIGSLVVERIFLIPGIGDMFVTSVSNRDTPLVLGISVFFCASLIFMNLIVDSLYPILNPRLRK